LLDNASDTKKAFFADSQTMCDIAYLLCFVSDQYVAYTDEASDDNEVETALETVISNEHKSFSDLFESRKVLQSSSAARTQVLRTQQSVLTKVYPLGKRQDNDIYQWFFWMKKNQSSRKFSKPIN
jgi:hypothetical protein